MPINLDSFRRIANTNQSNVRLSDRRPDVIKTRGALGAWFAAKINPDQLRTENTSITNAFITALREDAANLPSNLDYSKDPIKEEYRARLNDAIELISNKLESQRLGNAKLSSSDVRAALRFIDEVKAEAIADISIEEAEYIAEEASVVSKLLNPNHAQAGKINPGTILQQYLQGEPVSKENRKIAKDFIHKASNLALQSSEALRRLENNTIPDETEVSAHERAQATQRLKELGPALNVLGAFKWLVDADNKIEEHHAKADATSVRVSDDATKTSPRNASQLVEAFHHGEKLSADDLAFLKAWAHNESGIKTSLIGLKHHSELKSSLGFALKDLYKTHEFGLNQLGLNPYPEAQELEVTDLRTSAENPTGDVRSQGRPIAEFIEDQLWIKNDDVLKAQQQYAVLAEKVRIAINSNGDISQATLSVDPWRTRPEGSDIRPGDRGDLGPLKDQPEESARKGVPTLAERTRAWEKREAQALKQFIYRNQETNWAHEPTLHGDDYRVGPNGLSPEGKVARTEHKEEANVRDGFSADGKTLASGATSAARRRNQEVAIDRDASHANSVSELIGTRYKHGTDPFEGLDEASEPERPRRRT